MWGVNHGGYVVWALLPGNIRTSVLAVLLPFLARFLVGCRVCLPSAATNNKEQNLVVPEVPEDLLHSGKRSCGPALAGSCPYCTQYVALYGLRCQHTTHAELIEWYSFQTAK